MLRQCVERVYYKSYNDNKQAMPNSHDLNKSQNYTWKQMREKAIHL